MSAGISSTFTERTQADMTDLTTQMLTYKYRIYPTKEQVAAFDRLLNIGCHIYNDALNERIVTYQQTGESLSAYDQAKLWRAYRQQHADLQSLPSDTIADLIDRLDLAYQAFFKRRKDGVGFPKAKKRHDFRSLDYRYRSKRSVEFKVTSEKRAKLYLMGVGDIKVHMHRPLPEGTQIRFVSVLHDTDDTYWASLQIKFAAEEAPIHLGCAVGIDLGLHYLLALSNGEVVENPRWYRTGKRTRRVMGRKLTRSMRATNPQNFNADKTTKKGVFIWHKSSRYKKTLVTFRRQEAKTARQRRHFWDVLTYRLTREFSVIALEALTLDFMQKNKRLAMSVYDAGFGMFWSMLEYKAKRTGTRLIYVPPQYTSQTCSACGHTAADNRKTQSDFTCVECGHHENADINAAKNILERARLAEAWA